ncbi:LysR family transcriptional regulator [Chromohalobacter marismortui]|uniref:LysR family transcriptional regulator n=1 Tax=Chromohalobacter marismortui TaxID=42055 RepID=A0A4R7NRY2_9GAMM|nr:LysR family transcriptional regulator [Chromohalobacter marismortui]MCI0551902.1 LysR family transcriptional regulator [Anaerolineae bacterium]TDU23190.1 LysR family transcriptional regulator [Chromohalobacter marismortui]
MMRLEFRHLETAYWIYRLGSYGAAAERLNTTQPNISMRIADMEERIGRVVFQRGKRPVTLTAAGRELIGYAERILALRDELSSVFEDVQEATGRIRVGCTETVALWWLADFTLDVQRAMPNIELDIDVDITEKTWDKLCNGTIDLALVPDDQLQERVIRHSLGHASIAWMGAAELVQTRSTLETMNLIRRSILSLSPGSRLYADQFRWLDMQDIRPDRLTYCNTMSVTARLACEGAGVALLPPDLFSDDSQLQALEVQPAFASLPFVATYLSPAFSPSVERIAKLAVANSGFHLGESQP